MPQIIKVINKKRIASNERIIRSNHTELNTFDLKIQKKKSYNTDINNEFGRDIEKYLLKFDESYRNSEFLSKHKVDKELRAKMIDWMAEVLYTFKSDSQTFFQSVNIMDRYLKNTKRYLENKDVHLIGIVSMFIASKYEEVRPMHMKQVIKNIAHGKFTTEQIVLKEIEVLQTLQFKVGQPTIKEFIDMAYEKIRLYQRITLPDNFQKICYFIGKIICHSYNIIQVKPSILAAACIRIALEFCNRINKVVKQEIMNYIISEFKIEETFYKSVCKGVYRFFINFNSNFPQFQNITQQNISTQNFIFSSMNKNKSSQNLKIYQITSESFNDKSTNSSNSSDTNLQ